MTIASIDIQKIRSYFKQEPVLKAYLFGSHAKGMASEQSDIDILVELDYSGHIGLGFVRMQQELTALLGKEVDLVSTVSLSKYIKPIVDQEKKLIYAR